MLWDATAMTATAESEMIRDCPASGEIAPGASTARGDPCGRVLDAGGSPVPGLYAAGGTACGLAGPGSDGYSSGNGLLSAFGMGWIVGSSLDGRRA